MCVRACVRVCVRACVCVHACVRACARARVRMRPRTRAYADSLLRARLRICSKQDPSVPVISCARARVNARATRAPRELRSRRAGVCRSSRHGERHARRSVTRVHARPPARPHPPTHPPPVRAPTHPRTPAHIHTRACRTTSTRCSCSSLTSSDPPRLHTRATPSQVSSREPSPLPPCFHTRPSPIHVREPHAG